MGWGSIKREFKRSTKKTIKQIKRSVSDVVDWTIHPYYASLKMGVNYVAGLFEQPDPDFGGGSASIQGALVNKASASANIPVVIGKRRVGVARVLLHTQGSKNNYLYSVGVLCEGPIASVSSIEINDGDIASWGGSSSYSLVDNVRVALTSDVSMCAHLGSWTQQSDALFTSDLGDLWTADHKLSGVAYTATRYTYNAEKIGSLPTQTAVVEGALVYDPRDGQTKFSSNAALAILLYMRDDVFGERVPDEEIDFDSLKVAADIADITAETFSGSGESYRPIDINAVIDTSKSRLDNMNSLLAHAHASLPYSEGKYRLVIRSATEPSFDFNDDNISGDIGISSSGSGDKYNRVTVTFVDPDLNWSENNVVYPTDDDEYQQLLSEDNGIEKSNEITANMITNKYQALDYARRYLYESRKSLAISFTALPAARKVLPGQVVTVTTASLESFLFTVEKRVITADGEYKFTLKEYDPSLYSWINTADLSTGATPTLPNPFNLPAPQNIAFTRVAYNPDYQGELSWDESDSAFVTRYRVEIYNTVTGMLAWSNQIANNSVQIPNFPAGNYRADVKGLSEISATPNTSISWTYSVPVLPIVTGLQQYGEFDADLTLRWNAVSERTALRMYQVDLLLDDLVLYSVNTSTESITINLAQFEALGFPRVFNINVSAVNVALSNGPAASLTIQKPAPLPPLSVSFSPSVSSFLARLVKATNAKGVTAWLSTASPVDETTDNQIYSGGLARFEIGDLSPLTKYYVRIASYDAFGLGASSAHSVTTLRDAVADSIQQLTERDISVSAEIDDINLNLSTKQIAIDDINLDLSTKQIEIDDINLDLSTKQIAIDDINIDLSTKQIAIDDINLDLSTKQIAIDDINLDLSTKQIAIEKINISLDDQAAASYANFANSNEQMLLAAARAAEVRRQQQGQNDEYYRILNAVVEIDPSTGTITNRAYEYTNGKFSEAALLIDGVNASINLQATRIETAEGRLTDAESELSVQAGLINQRATYTQLTETVANAITAIQPAYATNFNTGLDGWGAENGTAVYNAGAWIDLTLGDIASAMNYVGSENPVIQLTIARAAGAAWIGKIQYQTASHGYSSAHEMGINEIPDDGQQYTVSVDFGSVTDYTASTITGLRIILGETTADAYQIHSVQAGKRTAALAAIEGLQGRVSVAEQTIDAVNGQLSNYVTTTFYEQNTLTQNDVQQTLDSWNAQYSIIATLTQLDENGTITKANSAEQWIDGAEALIAQIAQSTAQEEFGTRITSVEQTLDAQNGTIAQQITSIHKAETAADQLGSAALLSAGKAAAAAREQVSQKDTIALARSETKAVADDLQAEASRVDQLFVQYGESNEAAIQQEAIARADADSSLAQTIETVQSKSDDNEAAIQQEATARANADSSLAQTIATVQSKSNDNEAAIQQEATARADADSSLAQTIETVQSKSNDNEAAIQQEATARADADSSLAQTIETVQSKSDDNEAAIQQEATARADADSSLAQTIETVQSKSDDNEAAIQQEATARANADSSLAQTIATVQSKSNDNEAAIQQEATARADADSSLAQTIETVQSKSNDNEAAIQQEAIARADADSSLAQTIETVQSKSNDNEAAIQQEAIARADADSSLAQTIATVQSKSNDNEAAIQQEATARADADSSLAQTIETVQSKSNSNEAAIQQEAIARADADSSLAQTIETVQSKSNSNEATIQQEAIARADADSSLAQTIETVQSKLDDNEAAIQQEATARAGADESLAQTIETVQSKSNDNEAAIQQEATARADADSSLAQTIATVQSKSDDNEAAIQQEATARAGADESLAQTIATVQSKSNDNEAAIQQEAATRADENGSISQLVVTVQSKANINDEQLGSAALLSAGKAAAAAREQVSQKDTIALARSETKAIADDLQAEASRVDQLFVQYVENNEAAIQQEAIARVNADSSLAQTIETVQSKSNSNEAAIQQEATARADADESLAQTIATVQSKSNDNEAAIQQEATARADADSSLAQTIEIVQSKSNSNEAAIQQEATARADADESLAQTIATVQSKSNDNEAAIQQEATARADADESLAQTIATVQSKSNDNEAAIQQEATSRADADSSLAQTIETVQSKSNSNEAAIQQEATARADADESLAQTIATVQSKSNDNEAAIQQEATARADADSSLAQSVESLSATVGNNKAEVDEYKRTAIGYCVDDNGNPTSHETAVTCELAGNSWMGESSIAEALRNVKVTGTNADGEAVEVSAGAMYQAILDTDGQASATAAVMAIYGNQLAGIFANAGEDGSSLEFLANQMKFRTENGTKTPFSIIDDEVVATDLIVSSLRIPASSTDQSPVEVTTFEQLKGNKGDKGAAGQDGLDGTDGILPAPTGAAGLFANDDYLGYHDGDSWQTFIDKNGGFFFRDGNGNYVTNLENDGTLSVKGHIEAVSGAFSGDVTIGGKLDSTLVNHFYGYVHVGPAGVSSQYDYTYVTDDMDVISTASGLKTDSYYLLLDFKPYIVQRSLNCRVTNWGGFVYQVGELQYYNSNNEWQTACIWWDHLENHSDRTNFDLNAKPAQYCTPIVGRGLDGALDIGSQGKFRIKSYMSANVPGPQDSPSVWHKFMQSNAAGSLNGGVIETRTITYAHENNDGAGTIGKSRHGAGCSGKLVRVSTPVIPDGGGWSYLGTGNGGVGN